MRTPGVEVWCELCEVSSDSRPIPSTVCATAFTCILPRFIGGVDMDDYNTPKPPVYRVIVPSQNRNGCFRHANQHSLLPATPPHACSAAHAPAPRDGACACTGMCMQRGALMHAPDLRYDRSMTRLFFRLFVWLSISVLSLQGGAAMAIGQAEAPAHASMAMAGHAHHHMASRSGGDHCCESAAKAPAASHAKCPACASCCVGGAAPPAQLPDFHVPSTACSPHAGVEAAMTSFVPAPLDRPPRNLFV
jgi:hypothetical protein